MKTFVRLSFGGATVAEVEQRLRAAGCGPDVANMNDVPVLRRVFAEVYLEEGDPRIQRLCEQLRRDNVLFGERHDDRYSEAEMDTARLLLFHPPFRTNAIEGGVRSGTTFDLSGACPVCATGCRQTSAWFIDGEDVPKLEEHRAVESQWNILVDEGLASELESAAVSGLSFRAVYAVMPDKRQVRLRWKQLCADNELPPMSSSTTGFERADQSEKVQACNVCKRNGYGLMNEVPPRPVYRAADLQGALDVNVTWENYWGACLDREDFRQSILSRPWLLATPKVYRIFRDAGVTELEFYPIRVEDG